MDEFRQIPIENDGKNAGYGEHIRSYDNDNPRYIKEDALSEQEETFRVKESFSEPESSYSARREEPSVDLSSAASTSSAASAASAVGGSIGALAGVVATTVVAAVIVVAAFISTLTINLSLVMSDMYSLVFEVEMHGAQEEDFNNPDNKIYAVLTADDGTRREQEIKIDTSHLTFDALAPGKEYTIAIKNSEKTFTEKSYFTATKPVEKGEVLTSMLDSVVLVSVKDVKLGKNEYYTITVKDAQGNVVYSKDGVDPNAEYSFTMSEPKSLFVSVAVNGKAFALSEIEYAPEPSVDPDPTVDPDPSIDPNPTVDPTDPAHEHTYGSLISATAATCETNGVKAHYYCEGCGTYFDEDKNEVTEESLAIGSSGHNYAWVETSDANCENAGTEAHYYCDKCGKYFNILKKEVSAADLTIRPYNHYYGSLIQGTPANCDEDGQMDYYRCDRCGKCFDADKNETTEDALVISALGHELGSLIERVKATSPTEANGVLPHYACSRCGNNIAEDGKTKIFELNYRLTYNNPSWEWTYDSAGVPVSATATFTEVHGDDDVILDANILRRIVSYADCENPGYAFCTADVTLYEQNYYTYESDQSESFVTDSPLGHLFGTPEFIWTQTDGSYSATAVFTCSRDVSHVEQVEAEVTFSAGLYNATAEFDGDLYYDQFDPNVNLEFGSDSRSVYITPTRYGRSSGETLPAESDLTPLVTSENAEIRLSGNYSGDVSPINVYRTDDGKEASNVYLSFSDLTASTYYGTGIVRVNSTGELNIHISFKGTVELSSEEGAVFYSEGGQVNVYLYLADEEQSQLVSWVFDDEYGGSLFDCSKGEIRVYMAHLNDATSEIEWIELTSNYMKKKTTPRGSGIVSVGSYYVTLYSDGYSYDKEYSFENTSSNRYEISGNRTGDNPLIIDTRKLSGESSGSSKVTYYLTFKDLTLTASSWASALAIKIECDIDIYIVNDGSTSIYGYNHPAFSIQPTDGSGHTINIYVESENGVDSFSYGRQDGTSSPTLYNTPSGCTVNFYINNVMVGENG